MTTTVQNVSAASAATAASTSSGAGGSASSTSTSSSTALGNTFLTLLVTQLQNQDPLNPLDNSQMTSQLAQINTVNGIDQLNTTVQSLAASFTANQYLQAAALVGHKALIHGSSISLASGSASGAAVLPQAVDSMQVAITDASGSTVRTLNLGPQPAGTASFSWDGKNNAGKTVADGTYSISITAAAHGAAVAATPLESGAITGVLPGAQGTQVKVGSFGAVNLTDLVQIN